jgi:hypothetical protein
MPALRFSPGSCRRGCVVCGACAQGEAPRRWLAILPWKTYVLDFRGLADSPPTCIWRADVAETAECPEPRFINRVELRLDEQLGDSRRITLFIHDGGTTHAVWRRDLAGAQSLDCRSSYSLPKTPGGTCSTTTSATIVPLVGCCPCAGVQSSTSSAVGCVWCIGQLRPAALQVTFSGIVNAGLCSECHLLDTTFVLETYYEFANYCYWEYRDSLACEPGGFFLCDAWLQTFGSTLVLFARLLAAGKGFLTWSKVLSSFPADPLLSLDCLHIDETLNFDPIQSSQSACNAAASTCRVVAIP